MSRDRQKARLVARVALGSFAVLVVLLAGGALPAFSSPTAPVRHIVPLRVQDPAAYRQAKAAAGRRYELWRQRRGLTPMTVETAPLTAVSGSLNQPGITDAATTGTPSDSTGAIGPSNYVEFINSEIAVYSNTSLSAPTQGPVDESTFVADPAASTCDPQIQWDEQGQRWLYAALNCGANTGSQAFYFGFSKTSSPDLTASNWCPYTVPTAHSIEDYPKLGHDDSQIIIGTNAFNDTGAQNYTGSNIWVFDKPSPGDIATCPASGTELGDKLEASADGFTPVPANIADSSATGYVADVAFDQAHLHLYAIGRNGGGNNAVLSTTSVAVPTFGVPANVPQPGTTDALDSSDTRLTQAVAATDPATGQEGIWTQHTVAGPGGGPSVIRWYELTPGPPHRTRWARSPARVAASLSTAPSRRRRTGRVRRSSTTAARAHSLWTCVCRTGAPTPRRGRHSKTCGSRRAPISTAISAVRAWTHKALRAAGATTRLRHPTRATPVSSGARACSRWILSPAVASRSGERRTPRSTFAASR